MAKVSVLGPGAVGGFLAAALAHAGTDVVVVAREATAELIGRDGIAVQSVRLGGFVGRPRSVSMLEEPVDVLVVATKAPALAAALDRIGVHPPLIVPLLNGLDHMSLLRERFGSGPVAAGAIRIEATRTAPGTLVHTSPFLRVDLASDHQPLHPALRQLEEELLAAQIPATIGPSEAQILWSKLVRLNALACTTSASGRPIGFIRSDPQWRAVLVECITETAAVAAADGGAVDPSVPLGELDNAHPELRSSLYRDIAAGRESELDAIPGAVLRAARRHRLECPTTTRLAAEIAARAGLPAPAA